VVKRASGEGLRSARVEVPTDDEDFDTAMSYTIFVTVTNWLGQVDFFWCQKKTYFPKIMAESNQHSFSEEHHRVGTQSEETSCENCRWHHT